MRITRFYEATDSLGVKHTRSTVRADRNYSHCIIARGHCTYGDKAPFVTAEWASRKDLAEAVVRKWLKKPHCNMVEMIDARLVLTSGRL